MKYLFIGDLHIKSENKDDVDLLLIELLSILSEDKNKTCEIILGGDVMHYHERLFTQPLNQALHFIQTLASITHVYILVGNHDYINNSQFLSTHHWMNAMKTWKNVTIIDHTYSSPDQLCLFVPYVPPGRFVEALETVDKRWNYREVIFCHQEFRGCKMGAIKSIDGDEWDDDFPLVISGHIHDHQMVGKKIIYPGTPIQHSYGDSTVRRIYKVHVEKENTWYEWIDLDMPKKYVLHLEIRDLTKLDEFKKKDRVKVKIESTPAEFSLFKKTMEYKMYLEKGVRFQLVEKREKNVEEESEDNGENKNIIFLNVLEDLIKNEEQMVRDLFKELIHNNKQKY